MADIDWATVDLSTVNWAELDGDDPEVAAHYFRYWLQGSNRDERDALTTFLHNYALRCMQGSADRESTDDADPHGATVRLLLADIIEVAQTGDLEGALNAMAEMIDSEHDDVGGIGLGILDHLIEYTDEHPHTSSQPNKEDQS